MSLYDRVLERFARSKPGGWMFVEVFTHIDRRLMRWTNARLNTGIGSKFRKNALLLTAIGRKSGKPRDIPLLFVRDGENIVLIASNVGRPNNPAWYYNLKATPECTVRVGGERIDCVAAEATGPERERLWQRAVDVYAGYEEYAQRTERPIPIMVLRPR